MLDAELELADGADVAVEDDGLFAFLLAAPFPGLFCFSCDLCDLGLLLERPLLGSLPGARDLSGLAGGNPSSLCFDFGLGGPRLLWFVVGNVGEVVYVEEAVAPLVMWRRRAEVVVPEVVDELRRVGRACSRNAAMAAACC